MTQGWLMAARALQGAGAALAAPAALSLIATTFPEGAPRNRALGVYAAMSGGGGAVGLLVGGILTTYWSWRGVLFVNVPIGIAVAVAAPLVLPSSGRTPRRLDVPGVLTSASGVALLVFGLTHAAPGPSGVSHWGSPVTVASLAAAVALLCCFGFIEQRVAQPEVPLGLVTQRRRAGAYLLMLTLSTAMFSLFFFMTLFVQSVRGYSAVRTGIAWLGFPVTTVTKNIIVSRRLVGRLGVRPLLLAGTLVGTAGFLWFSRISEHGSYWTTVFGPMVLVAAGFGLMFVPLTLTAVAGVAAHETGVAAGMLNTSQQLGGAIGLAAVGTVAWETVASTLRGQTAALGTGAASSPSAVNHALTVGFSRGFLAAAGVAALGFVVALVSTRSPEPARQRTEACDLVQCGQEPAPACCLE
jgi:predicted MFS family arabinose efflux permease